MAMHSLILCYLVQLILNPTCRKHAIHKRAVESDKINKGLIFFFSKKEKIILQGQNKYPESLSVTADTKGGGEGKSYRENVVTYLHSGLNYASRIINGRT